MAEEQLVVTSSPKKKIGFFSAILVVLGSSIGVGIFLRSKSVLVNSANNVVWAMIVWLIAGFAVITMALALVEVASGRNDNLGMIGWTKAFSTLYLYKGNKFFMTYLYLPFTYFFMPYYVIVQFQDGLAGFVGYEHVGFGGSTAAPWIYFAIGLAITLWMIFSSGISSRAGNIQNWIITSVKFIPIVAIIIIGFYFTGVNVKENQPIWHAVTAQSLFDKTSTSFLGLSPFLAVFASLGGIFFAFDGFYVTAGMQTEMKNPEKTPAALVIGLSSMTVLYIVIATAMTLGGTDGGFYGFGDALAKKNAGWVFGVINIMISIGVIGILNGFSIWATRWVEDLIKEGEMFVPVKAYRYLKHSKTPIVGALFCLFISLPIMVIFTAIGSYAYIGGGYTTDYGYKIDNLLTFSDLMANWMAVFAFAFICAAIVGAIQNRKQHFIAVQENKHTIWAGYTSVIIILLTMFFLVIDPFISTGITAVKYSLGDAKVKAELTDALTGYAATSVLFIFYLIVMFASTPIEKAIAVANKKKYDRVLSGNICPCEKPDWCPCKLAELREKAELNDLILATYADARR
ncbi:APC family permease [Metamycoplasma neophronis]|uniref:APC family permease n=1 Tax=Metamycoplasma neophronis TaxID=872983 RepID=A0ABY2Z0U6_9BACT|nr:APC family permease [Metamycoplasma neophronis]TPR54302.1 APC family permease [Metamycoplasma neophronis]